MHVHLKLLQQAVKPELYPLVEKHTSLFLARLKKKKKHVLFEE